MPWLKIDDGMMSNPKITALSDAQFRGYMAMLCHCARHLTDGHVDEKARLGLRLKPQSMADYEAKGLVIRTPTGWLINDYLEYNPSREMVLQERENSRERQARYRQRNAVTNAVSNGRSNAVPSRPLYIKKGDNAVTRRAKLSQAKRLIQDGLDSGEELPSVLDALRYTFKSSPGIVDEAASLIEQESTT